jgi:hypothetical protein
MSGYLGSDHNPLCPPYPKGDTRAEPYLKGEIKSGALILRGRWRHLVFARELSPSTHVTSLVRYIDRRKPVIVRKCEAILGNCPIYLLTK